MTNPLKHFIKKDKSPNNQYVEDRLFNTCDHCGKKKRLNQTRDKNDLVHYTCDECKTKR